jgi:hypothetical protein
LKLARGSSTRAIVILLFLNNFTDINKENPFKLDVTTETTGYGWGL